MVNTFPQQYQGGIREAPTSLDPISFIFIQFSEKTFGKQDCIPVGCVPPVDRISLVPGGGCAWSWGGEKGVVCLVPGGGVPGPGGLVCLVGGGVPQHALRQTPPVNRMTNRCKNNTLPQTSFADGNNKLMPPLVGFASPVQKIMDPSMHSSLIFYSKV